MRTISKMGLVSLVMLGLSGNQSLASESCQQRAQRAYNAVLANCDGSSPHVPPLTPCFERLCEKKCLWSTVSGCTGGYETTCRSYECGKCFEKQNCLWSTVSGCTGGYETLVRCN